MKKYFFKGIILVLSIILFSCVTNKKLTYLQYEGMRSDTVISVTPRDYKVLPFDNLFIKVVTPDPKVSEIFNMTPAGSSGQNSGEQSADLLSYRVDNDGYILIPYAGKIAVAGKNLATITLDVEAAMNNYIADAAVTVKMVNNYISILGEVNRPGRYPIYKDRLNIFQALAMGGDLGLYSNRQIVQIIRPTARGNVVKDFSLTDRSIMTSEYFYVLPNDVIYAKPSKGRFFQMGSFPYALIISTITTGLLMYNVLK